MHACIHIKPHISQSARRYWNSWEDVDAHRCEGLHRNYHVAKEELTHGALRVPTGVMPNSNQTVSMHLRAGSGGFSKMPQAPLSSHLQVIMHNFFCLQWMVPEQAEKILRDTAALQGRYEDFLIRPLHGASRKIFSVKSSALCVRLRRRAAIRRARPGQAAWKSNTGLAPFSHNLEHQVERLLLCFSSTGKP